VRKKVKYHVIYLHRNDYPITVMAENFFSILKTECIYQQKIPTFQHARELIDEFVYFYNHERTQLKIGETPLARRLST
jgi:putative transposase